MLQTNQIVMASLRISDENLNRFRTLSDSRKPDRFMTMLMDAYEEKVSKMRIIDIDDSTYERVAAQRQGDETVDECFERIVKQYAEEARIHAKH